MQSNYSQASVTEWRKIRNKIKRNWKKLDDDEIDRSNGDILEIGNLIRQSYGEAQYNYSKKLTDIFKIYEK